MSAYILNETEADLASWVLDLAQLYGWRRVHFRPAKTDRGWRTPIEGDGIGFPDFLFLRGSQGIAVELKSARGRATPEQTAWLEAFRATGWDAFVWRPSDRDEAMRVLR